MGLLDRGMFALRRGAAAGVPLVVAGSGAQAADDGDQVNLVNAGNGGSGAVETSGAISTGDLGSDGVVGNTVVAGDISGTGTSLDGGTVSVDSTFAIGNSGGPATINAGGGDFADASVEIDERRPHNDNREYHDNRDVFNEDGGNLNPPDFSS